MNRKYNITIICFQLINIIYLIVHVTILISIRSTSIAIPFAFTKINLAMYGIYYIGVAIFLSFISKYPKNNLLKDLFLLDLPGLAAITFLLWRGPLYNLLGYGNDLFGGYLIAGLLASETADTLRTIGGLILGVEVYRFWNYYKTNLQSNKNL